MKKNILIVTGTRAEYGLLKNLIALIESSKELNLILLATGSHLSKKYGLTYKEIEKDNFKINRKVDI